MLLLLFGLHLSGPQGLGSRWVLRRGRVPPHSGGLTLPCTHCCCRGDDLSPGTLLLGSYVLRCPSLAFYNCLRSCACVSATVAAPAHTPHPACLPPTPPPPSGAGGQDLQGGCPGCQLGPHPSGEDGSGGDSHGELALHPAAVSGASAHASLAADAQLLGLFSLPAPARCLAVPLEPHSQQQSVQPEGSAACCTLMLASLCCAAGRGRGQGHQGGCCPSLPALMWQSGVKQTHGATEADRPCNEASQKGTSASAAAAAARMPSPACQPAPHGS